MTPKEAAEKLRENFVLASMPPEARHHVKFVEDVAAELGIEPTAFNLYQVAEALDRENLHEDDNAYPKILYSLNPAEGVAATRDDRNKWYWIQVADDDEAEKLGPSWVSDPALLSGPVERPALPTQPPAPTSEPSATSS